MGSHVVLGWIRAAWLCIAAVALQTTIVSTVHAQRDLDARARSHFEAGSAYFETGEYEDALREFQRAYRLSQRPELLYNLSLVYEYMGDFTNAADSLTQYLAARPNVPQRATLEIRITNLRERAQRAAEARSGTTRPAGSTSTGPTQSTTTESEAETATAVVEGEEEHDEGGGIGTPATIAFIAAGVGAAAFGTFGILALSEDSSLSDSCGADAGRTCTDDDVSTLETYSLLADIGLGVAMVGAATGLALWLTGTGVEDNERGSVAVTPWIGPNVAGAAGEVRF